MSRDQINSPTDYHENLDWGDLDEVGPIDADAGGDPTSVRQGAPQVGRPTLEARVVAANLAVHVARSEMTMLRSELNRNWIISMNHGDELSHRIGDMIRGRGNFHADKRFVLDKLSKIHDNLVDHCDDVNAFHDWAARLVKLVFELGIAQSDLKHLLFELEVNTRIAQATRA